MSDKVIEFPVWRKDWERYSINGFPVWSSLFPDTISGYGRLFMLRPPKFMIDHMEQFKHVDSYSQLIGSLMPSIEDVIMGHGMRIVVRPTVRPEDVHFPEEFKRKNAKSKELRFMIKDTHKENKELDDWFEKQDDIIKTLINQPGPNPYQNEHEIPPAEYKYNPHIFPDFDPFIT